MHFRKVVDKRLGELLIEQGIIHHEQLETALKHQKENGGLIGEVLVQLKYATERDIAQALTAQYGFPYLPLTHYDIDAEVLRVVPGEICREFVLIPIDKIGQSLTIAMANPLDTEAMKKVESLTGCTVQTFVGTTTDIKEAIEKYYKNNQ
jgi:type IV pilus assembly protein PilB